MAKKKRGFKKTNTPAATTNPTKVVYQDFGIQIRHVDTTRKDLDKWRSAYQSAIMLERPSREELYQLYKDIMLDDHLESVIAQRRLAVTNSNIVFQKDGNPVDSVNAVLNSEHFATFIKHCMDRVFYGYSLVYVDFRNDTFQLVPRAHVIPSKRIVVKDPYDDQGIDYSASPYKNYYLGVGEDDDLGLLLIATPLVILKRGNISDWAQFNEIFGQPLRKGSYDPHQPGSKNQLLEAMENTAAMSYVVVPKGADVEFVEANKSGASDTYDKFDDRMEKGISKLIVGQTMTTEDGSSRSQGEVHERVAQAIAQSDRLFITKLFNGRVREMLIAQGFPEAANGEFQFIDEEATISKKDRLTMDIQIHEKVGALKREYFEEEYNVPFDEEAIKKQEEEKAKAAEQIPEPGKGNKKEDPEKVKMALTFFDRFRDFFL